MKRSIFKASAAVIKLMLLSCSLPLVLTMGVWGQNRCTEAQIKANIAEFKHIKAGVDVTESPVYEAVVKCGSKSIKPLIAVVKDKTDDADVRSYAASALGSVELKSATDISTLVAVVKDKTDNADVRYYAVEALSSTELKSVADISTLVAVVKDKTDDADVRSYAASALGSTELKSAEVINTLVAVVKDKTDNADVRSSVASALGSVELKSATDTDISALVAVVKDKTDNANVRYYAVEALSSTELKSAEVINTLIAVVKDKTDDAEVRSYATEALSSTELKLAEVINTLVAVAKDKTDDTEVRSPAVEALDSLKSNTSEVINTLLTVMKDKTDDAEVRSLAVEALGSIKVNSEEVINTLVTVLKDKTEDASFRSGAALSLGSIKANSPEVINTLVTVIKNKTEDANFRSRAITALGSIGSNSLEVMSNLVAVMKNKAETASFRSRAASSLSSIGLNLQEKKDSHTPLLLKQYIKSFEEASHSLKDEQNKDIFAENSKVIINNTIRSLQEELESRRFQQISKLVAQGGLIHVGFWVILIFAYPYSKQIQAIFFWNPKVRKIIGLWYVDFALTWIPFLRYRYFLPFKDSLLSDAKLEEFNSQDYFENSNIKLKTKPENFNLQSIKKVIPEIKGQIILEGESGLGKSMFLRHSSQKTQRIVVYLPAKKCDSGVEEAIKAKLHGHAKEDQNFLNSLIYSGAIDICIDGLNEVTPDTRASITKFVETYCKGNIIMTTQPLEWIPPSTAKTYILQSLKPEQIEEFLISRPLPSNTQLTQSEYQDRCKIYLSSVLKQQQSEEQNAILRMLSNPMELTIVSEMLARKEEPNLLNLQQQQYDIMKEDYKKINFKEFPLDKFSEAVYQMRINDQAEIPNEQWQKELDCMENYKMVISRQSLEADNTSKTEWYFRHDKIQEFFIVQTFLEKDNEDRLTANMSDPRFRGVYFLLAKTLPLDEAQSLREMLIEYAVDHKDHTISDRFIQLLRSRQKIEKKDAVAVSLN